MFTPIAKVVAAVLAFFYSLVPNYGVAIMLLTVAVMVLIAPLTIKSTRSMLGMQKLQPEMKKLQQEFKNDRAALNEATMALYKEHGVSPLGGCLPMLLPFPVFFALFRTIDGLGHRAKNGASAPQYLNHTTLMYRHIVSSNGHLNAFGVNLATAASSHHSSVVAALPYFFLVLIMMGTQYYQQVQLTRRNPTMANNPQAKMMKFLPLIFGLFFIRFPAGVIVYYATSNILRIAQQWAMYRYDPKVRALAVADGKELEAKAHEIETEHKSESGRQGFRSMLSAAQQSRDANPRQVEARKKDPSTRSGSTAKPARPAKPSLRALLSGAQDQRAVDPPAGKAQTGSTRRPAAQGGTNKNAQTRRGGAHASAAEPLRSGKDSTAGTANGTTLRGAAQGKPAGPKANGAKTSAKAAGVKATAQKSATPKQAVSGNGSANNDNDNDNRALPAQNGTNGRATQNDPRSQEMPKAVAESPASDSSPRRPRTGGRTGGSGNAAPPSSDSAGRPRRSR